MHDLFDVLGLSRNAPAGEIRRVCARRSRRSHPDFRPVESSPLASLQAPDVPGRPTPSEIAIDFVDMTALLDRIEGAFFSESR